MHLEEPIIERSSREGSEAFWPEVVTLPRRFGVDRNVMIGTIMRKLLVPREFSTIPDQWHFAPILDTGDFVFFSGITGVHPNGSLSDDPETQFRDTFRFVGVHLETAGLHFGDIVEMTTCHVDLRKHLNTFIKVKDEFVRTPYPAWTAIGIVELITEGSLLETRDNRE
jgi:enamine deaminase RidA (YjgF/YER057c/UK114 family)